MQVNPTNRSLYHNGAEVGRYGRDLDGDYKVFVWYHDGLRGSSQPTWAMDVSVEQQIDDDVSVILVADANAGKVYQLNRNMLCRRTVEMDGREQHMAKASDNYVYRVATDPSAVLKRELWIESGNEVNEGYHKIKNEA